MQSVTFALHAKRVSDNADSTFPHLSALKIEAENIPKLEFSAYQAIQMGGGILECKFFAQLKWIVGGMVTQSTRSFRHYSLATSNCVQFSLKLHNILME